MVGGVGTRRSAAHFVHENDLHMQEGVEGGACGGLLFLCFFPAPRALNPADLLCCLAAAKGEHFEVSCEWMSVRHKHLIFSIYASLRQQRAEAGLEQHSNSRGSSSRGTQILSPAKWWA